MMKSRCSSPLAIGVAAGLGVLAFACSPRQEGPSSTTLAADKPATSRPGVSPATTPTGAKPVPSSRGDDSVVVDAGSPATPGHAVGDKKDLSGSPSVAGPEHVAAAKPVSPPHSEAATGPHRGLGQVAAEEPAPPASPRADSLGKLAARGTANAAPEARDLDEEATGGAYGEPAQPEEMPLQAFAEAPMPAPVWIAPPSQPVNTERYRHLDDNPVHAVASDPVSTFSLDVDTGSYSNVRRFLAQGHRPPVDAVRVEEMVNYFPYDYPRGSGEHPFGVRAELAPCPWKNDHWLMRVAVRADDVAAAAMPPANLVFLVDVSGSMDEPAKLPLLQSSLKLLVEQLRREDRVSLVVYAGREAVVLEPTPGDDHARIARAIDALTAGGSTAGEAGIRLAYRMAREHFVKEGINRVLLATDGDFNVGVTDFQQLKDLVARERESGVQLSTLGFGTGNTNEALMEQLADVGNGSYAYIDNLMEGRKVLVDQVRSTLVTVAKDVKIQVEFNPAAVSEYRLIGYENRILAREDFNNDKIDAGDVGAGQSVTALYELTPVGTAPSVDPLRYGAAAREPGGRDDAAGRATSILSADAAEVAFVKLRYKRPDASASRLMETPVHRASLLASFAQAGDDFRFATAVAAFGQLLKGGKATGAWNLDDVLGTATASRGKDEFGYRGEFLSLVRMAKVSG